MFERLSLSLFFFLSAVYVIPAHSKETTVDVFPVYTVQVASSSSEDNAQNFLSKLRNSGYDPFILDVISKNTLWKTIHVGKFLDIDEAKIFLKKFKSSNKIDAIIFQTNSKLYDVFISRRKKAGLEVFESSLFEKKVEELPDAQEEVLVQDESDSQEDDQEDEITEQSKTVEISQAQEQTQEQLPIPSLETQRDEVKKSIDKHWYVLASLGVSRIDFSGSDLDQELSSKGYTTSSDIDQNSFAWKIIGGYKFSKNFSVEGGYVNLGHYDTEILETDTNTNSFVSDVGTLAPLAIEGGLFETVGVLPLGKRFALLGKAGGLVWSGESSLADDNGTDFVLGVGTSYKFNQRFAIRVEWERFFLNEDFDLISGGVEASF